MHVSHSPMIRPQRSSHQQTRNFVTSFYTELYKKGTCGTICTSAHTHHHFATLDDPGPALNHLSIIISYPMATPASTPMTSTGHGNTRTAFTQRHISDILRQSLRMSPLPKRAQRQIQYRCCERLSRPPQYYPFSRLYS